MTQKDREIQRRLRILRHAEETGVGKLRTSSDSCAVTRPKKAAKVCATRAGGVTSASESAAAANLAMEAPYR